MKSLGSASNKGMASNTGFMVYPPLSWNLTKVGVWILNFVNIISHEYCVLDRGCDGYTWKKFIYKNNNKNYLRAAAPLHTVGRV